MQTSTQPQDETIQSPIPLYKAGGICGYAFKYWHLFTAEPLQLGRARWYAGQRLCKRSRGLVIHNGTASQSLRLQPDLCPHCLDVMEKVLQAHGAVEALNRLKQFRGEIP